MAKRNNQRIDSRKRALDYRDIIKKVYDSNKSTYISIVKFVFLDDQRLASKARECSDSPDELGICAATDVKVYHALNDTLRELAARGNSNSIEHSVYQEFKTYNQKHGPPVVEEHTAGYWARSEKPRIKVVQLSEASRLTVRTVWEQYFRPFHDLHLLVILSQDHSPHAVFTRGDYNHLLENQTTSLDTALSIHWHDKAKGLATHPSSTHMDVIIKYFNDTGREEAVIIENTVSHKYEGVVDRGDETSYLLMKQGL